MELCDTNHTQICYEGYECPLCKYREEKEGEIADLENQIAGLESEVNDLEMAAKDE